MTKKVLIHKVETKALRAVVEKASNCISNTKIGRCGSGMINQILGLKDKLKPGNKPVKFLGTGRVPHMFTKGNRLIARGDGLIIQGKGLVEQGKKLTSISNKFAKEASKSSINRLKKNTRWIPFLFGGVITKINPFKTNPAQKIDAKKQHDKDLPPLTPQEIHDNVPNKGKDHKMIIAVRMDLGMGKGKMCAQVGHGVLNAYISAHSKDPSSLKLWENTGQGKVCVKAQDYEHLQDIYEKAIKANLPASLIRDAGKTQIARGTTTVCAIGPGPEDVINEITGNLKLL